MHYAHILLEYYKGRIYKQQPNHPIVNLISNNRLCLIIDETFIYNHFPSKTILNRN